MAPRGLTEPGAPQAAGRAAAPGTGRTVAALSAAAFVSSATIRIADPLLPQIARTYGVTAGEASLVVTSFAVAYGVLQVVYGPLGDRLGKLRLVTGAMVGAAITTAACALAPSLLALAILRFASGSFAAAVIPLAIAWIGDAIAYEHRQATIARFMTGTMLGLVTGQSLSGVLTQFVDWRFNFLLLGFLFLVASAILLGEARRQPAGGSGIGRGLPNLLRQYGAVLRPAWARVVLLTVTVEGFLFYGALTYVSAFLRHDFDLAWTLIGLSVACFGVGGLIYIGTVRYLVHHLGETGMPMVGGVLMAAGFVILPFSPWWPVVPLLVAVLGLGFYMLHNTLQTNATQMVPEARGTAVAAFATCLFLGQGIGAAVLGRVVDTMGFAVMFPASGLLLLLVGAAFRRAKIRGERTAG